MATSDFTHFVFVDFENVPNVDLSAIGGKPVLVTLLIGKNQKNNLDFDLVKAIRAHAAQVQLVDVGASGHNALDLTLTFYLGRAVQENPAAHFHIVSKDKDFDPLIAHLKHLAAPDPTVRISRHDAFSALPFLPQPRKSAPLENKDAPIVDKLAKLVVHLQTKTKARPTRRKTLHTHINNFSGNLLSDAELSGIVGELVTRGVLKIDAKERVSY